MTSPCWRCRVRTSLLTWRSGSRTSRQTQCTGRWHGICCCVLLMWWICVAWCTCAIGAGFFEISRPLWKSFVCFSNVFLAIRQPFVFLFRHGESCLLLVMCVYCVLVCLFLLTASFSSFPFSLSFLLSLSFCSALCTWLVMYTCMFQREGKRVCSTFNLRVQTNLLFENFVVGIIIFLKVQQF